MKALVCELGLEPEKLLIQASFVEPHRIHAAHEDQDQVWTRVLSLAIKELIKKELSDSEETAIQNQKTCVRNLETP